MSTHTLPRKEQKEEHVLQAERTPDFGASIHVLNDDEYPAEQVIRAFCEVLPGYTKRRAFMAMWEIHRRGSGRVWQGPREVCELYTEQLESRGLKAFLV